MTTKEIKEAVDSGKNVYWQSGLYKVVKDKNSEYLIKCSNGSCIGLTWDDEETLNGQEEDFFTV